MKTFSIKLTDLKSYGNPFKDLLDIHHIDGIPENATYDIAYHKGDRPYDGDRFTITFTWYE